MKLRESILERLPRPTPKDELIVDGERHDFRVRTSESGADVPKTVYTLDKAPFNRLLGVTVTIDGRQRELDADQYEARDVDDDGQVDSVALTDADIYPEDGDPFYVTYVADSIIQRYVGAYDTDIETVSADLDEVIDSHQVENADVDELQLIGAIFGVLGRRRGLPAEDYRALLRSVIPSISGRGTKPGLKRAISVAVGGEFDDIVIREDFDQVGYRVDIKNVDADQLSAAAISEIIERADPSGVELLSAPILVYEGPSIGLEPQQPSFTQVSSGGLGGGNLGDGTL